MRNGGGGRPVVKDSKVVLRGSRHTGQKGRGSEDGTSRASGQVTFFTIGRGTTVKPVNPNCQRKVCVIN